MLSQVQVQVFISHFYKTLETVLSKQKKRSHKIVLFSLLFNTWRKRILKHLHNVRIVMNKSLFRPGSLYDNESKW